MCGHRLLRAAGFFFAAAAFLCLFACTDRPDREAVQTTAPVTSEPIGTTAPPSPAPVTPSPVQPVTVDVRFVGDIMVSKAMINGAALGDGVYDFNSIWDEIRPQLAGADFVIGNLETVIAGYDNGGIQGFPVSTRRTNIWMRCAMPVSMCLPTRTTIYWIAACRVR